MSGIHGYTGQPKDDGRGIAYAKRGVAGEGLEWLRKGVGNCRPHLLSPS